LANAEPDFEYNMIYEIWLVVCLITYFISVSNLSLMKSNKYL